MAKVSIRQVERLRRQLPGELGCNGGSCSLTSPEQLIFPAPAIVSSYNHLPKEIIKTCEGEKIVATKSNLSLEQHSQLLFFCQ